MENYEETLDISDETSSDTESKGEDRKMASLYAETLIRYMRDKADSLVESHLEKMNMISSSNEAKLEEMRLQYSTFSSQVDNIIASVSREMVDNSESRHKFERECLRLKAALPIYAFQRAIIHMISENQVSVLIGETGSGKSTQIVQYLYDHNFAECGQIVCTQPRKVAARSLAEHVATEMRCSVGNLVGYQVGMNQHVTKKTKIVFSTDHFLLNDCLKDPLFTKYGVVVIDEAHERSINTDLLLGLLKKCLPQRPDLRVLITSATVDPTVFQKYFNKCPMLEVPGRMFPVEIIYETKSLTSDGYISWVMEKVKEIHNTKPTGDILTFLVSPLDCEKCCELSGNLKNAMCLALHGQLAPDKYREIFNPCKEGIRKIIFATNCAETSITISGIKYVVDSGLAKEKQFDPVKNLDKLVVAKITQSSANQRKGRAGRVESGECHRLYTKEDYVNMQKNSVPEILRMNLGHALLYLSAFNIGNPMTFTFVESPNKECLERSYKLLVDLGALGDNGSLADIGKQMVHLPTNPRLSKFILLCCQNKVGFTGIAMAAMCTQGGLVFFRAGSDDDKIKADKKKAYFLSELGDAVSLLRVYAEWRLQTDKEKGKWCFENCINGKLMKAANSTIQDIHKALRMKCGITVNRDLNLAQNLQTALSLFVQCYLPDNICFYSGHDRLGYFVPQLKEYCQLHPSSAFAYTGLNPKLCMFESVFETSRKFLLSITAIPSAVLEDSLGFLDEAGKYSVIGYPITSLGQEVLNRLYNKRHQISAALGATFGDFQPVPFIEWSQRDKPKAVVIWSRAEHKDTILSHLKTYFITEIVTNLLSFCKEVSVGESTNVQALIGKGGVIISCQMPDEFRSVEIQLKNDVSSSSMNESYIRKQLGSHGEIATVYIPAANSKPFWVKVTFLNPSSAMSAVNHAEYDSFICKPVYRSRGRPKLLMEGSYCFINVEWLRRPCVGHAYAKFDKDVLDEYDFHRESFAVNGQQCLARRDTKDRNHLYITGLPLNCTKDALTNQGPLIFKRCSNIIVPLKNVNESVEEDARKFTDYLMKVLKIYNLSNDCIQVFDFTLKSRLVKAKISINNPHIGKKVYEHYRRTLHPFNGDHLTFSAVYHTYINIPVSIYKILEQDVEEDARNLKFDAKYSPDKHNVNGKLALKSADLRTITIVAGIVQQLVCGMPIECRTLLLKCLMADKHTSKLAEIMEESGTILQRDHRLNKLIIYGNEMKQSYAMTLLNSYLDELQYYNETTAEIFLQGHGEPRGLLKLFLREFHVDATSLSKTEGCISLHLDLQNKKLLFCGSNLAYGSIVEQVDRLKQQLQSVPASLNNESVDCPICLCAVDDSDFKQLSICGHKYCTSCLEAHIEHMIKERKLPMLCAESGCGEYIYINDLPIKQLVPASVHHLVSQQHTVYKYCPTPDCSNLFKVSPQPKAFYCTACNQSICRKCCKNSHDANISCEEAANDQELIMWMREDPDNRKQCPKCRQGIEKNRGCMHVHCIQCNAHICWICDSVFPSGLQVYEHIPTCRRLSLVF